MEFAQLENVHAIWDFLELIVRMLLQFIHVQIIVQEEVIVVRPIHHLQHSNAFVKIALPDQIAQEHTFFVQEIVQDKESANVMELVHVKVDLLELLANKLLTLAQTSNFVLEMEFAQMEHVVAILVSQGIIVL